MTSQTLIIRTLGTVDYQTTWQAMREFTDTRDNNTNDELWLLEHPPVFTQGQAGKPEHVLNTSHDIPIVNTDRGGQVTYHGPGQLVGYVLCDLRRLKQSIRPFVCGIETSVINTLNYYNIHAERQVGAPGIYINHQKICSLGLRVRRGCTYHGLAFNINMDLTPFSYINPCGFKNLAMTQVSDFNNQASMSDISVRLITEFCAHFGYTPDFSAAENFNHDNVVPETTC